MSRKRCNFEIIDLIEAVEERTCIWDKRSDDYKDRNAKDKAWKEVCSILDSNYENSNAIERKQIGKCLS